MNPPETFDAVVDGTTWVPDAQVLASLLDRAAQPFVVLGLDGRYLRVNRAFEELIGYSADELRQLTYADITAESSTRITAEVIRRLQQDGTPQHYEKRYRHKSGRLVPVALVSDVYRDQQGVARGYFAFVTDISDRIRTEAALRDSEERFRRLYDEAPIGYHEIDRDARIVAVNRTECEMLGYSRGELIGRSVLELVAADRRDEAAVAVAAKLAGERPLVPFERPYTTKDGRRLIIRIEERHVRDAAGRIVGLRSTLQDVTAAKQTEAALVASERRVRALFEGIQDTVFVHDLDGRILDANPAASRSLGYSREEFLNLSTTDFDCPSTAEGFRERLSTQLREGVFTFEGRHRTKSGHIIPVDISTSVIQIEDRAAVLAVVRDITERKSLEDARRQAIDSQLDYSRELDEINRELMLAVARSRQLVMGSLDPVIAADAAGRISQFNPAAEQTFGLKAAEVLGKPLDHLFPDDFQLPHLRGQRSTAELPAPMEVGRTVELAARRGNGESFPVELSLGAINEGGERQYIASIRDQTERQRMYAVLAQTEKLASIGLLSAGLAHEINNPLAYVSNNLAVLERDLQGIIAMLKTYDDERETIGGFLPDLAARAKALAEDLDWEYVRDNIDRTISRTRDGVQRVSNIVHNLRSLARTTPPRLEAASLADLIESSLEIVQGQIRKAGITVETKIEPGLPKLACAASQIGQVFLNLLVNALQAVEGHREPGEGRIRVTLSAGPGRQVVEVADNGQGIAPEHLSRLFDPFFTTKPVGEGTGLGLAFSHGIVSGHGGRIEVESQPGQGTKMRVVLPVRPGPKG